MEMKQATSFSRTEFAGDAVDSVTAGNGLISIARSLLDSFEDIGTRRDGKSKLVDWGPCVQYSRRQAHQLVCSRVSDFIAFDDRRLTCLRRG